MHYKKLFIVAVTTVITTSLESVVLLPGILPTQQVLAQTIEAREAEAGKLLLKGMQQFKANQLEPALQTFQKALIIFRNIKNRKGEAGALLGLGLVYSGLQDYSQGIDYYKQSLVIAREIKDSELEAILQLESHKTEAERLLNQGAQQLKANQLKLALQSVQKALIIYRDIKNRRGEGFALAFLGSVYSGLQDYPQAINYYKQSLVIAREIKDSELEALVQLELADAKLGSNPQKAEADRLLNQGIELYQKSQFKAALQSWEQALQIYREIKDRDGEGDILGNLGNVYLSLGEYKKAIELFQQALAIFKQIGDKAGVGRTLGNLGNAYYFLGEYKKAIEFHQQDLAIAKQIGDKAGVVRALGNLGLAYLYLGEYKKAIEFHQKSLAIAKQIGDKASEGGVLGNLGLAYHFLGDYQKAIEFHQQHLAIAKQIGDKAGVGRSLGNLGIAYNSLGDYQKAIELYQQLLAIAKQISDKLGEGTALGNLGTAYYKLGEYKKAIDLYQQHLAIAKQISDRESEGRALGNLGNVYLSLGEYKKAIDLYQQHLAIAKQIGKKAGEGLALGSLGNAYYSLGEYQKAIEYDQQYLAIAKQIGDKAGEGNALNNLGVTFFKSGNLAEAQRVLKQGIEVLKYQHSRQKKDEFKISIFEEQAKTYRILQQVYIAQNKPDGALEVAESGRARAFVDSLASRIFSNNKQLDKSTEPPTINQIKQIAKSQNSTFVQYSIIVDEFKIAGKRQVKESELYIWVIKPTGEVTFRKADLKYLWEEENTTLSKLVSTTRKSLGVGDDERSIFDVKVKNPVNEKIQRESLQKLHQLLVQPIADLLPTDPNQRVTFVPQEDLFLVPFPALMDSKGKYLIEKHTILTAPAIQVLELTRSQQQRIKSLPGKSRQNALIVGNPTMPKFNTKYGEPGKQLSSLPGAKREAEAIAPLFNTTALTGDEATETAIKAKLPEAGVIHLATHGLFDGFQALESSIALASSSQDNGLLTASEILDIKLNADLVVLSACNTGRGRITGDGVIGLSRSLFLAGTPSVLVSLWSVPDAPTAELMTEFYQNLYQKNLDKAQALRQAMLKMKQQYPKAPRKWAAFTLIGEAE